MLYWPTVKTASISCSVEYFLASAAQVASETQASVVERVAQIVAGPIVDEGD